MADFRYRLGPNGTPFAWQPGMATWQPVTVQQNPADGSPLYWHPGLQDWQAGAPWAPPPPEPEAPRSPGLLERVDRALAPVVDASRQIFGRPDPRYPIATAPTSPFSPSFDANLGTPLDTTAPGPMRPPPGSTEVEPASVMGLQEQQWRSGLIGRNIAAVTDSLGLTSAPAATGIDQRTLAAVEKDMAERGYLTRRGDDFEIGVLGLMAGVNDAVGLQNAAIVDAIERARAAIQADPASRTPGFAELDESAMFEALSSQTRRFIVDMARRGVPQLSNPQAPSPLAIVEAVTGKNSIEEAARQSVQERFVAAAQRRLEAGEIAVSPWVPAYFEAARKDGPLSPQARLIFSQAPLEITASLATQSLPMMAPPIIAGIIAGPGAAAVAGALPEYMISLSSAMADDRIVKLAAEKGFNLDPNDPVSLAAALQDKELRGEIAQFAATRGLAIGAFDALSQGFISAVAKVGRNAPQIVKAPASVATEGLTEATGEGLAGYLTTGEVDPTEVFTEGLVGAALGTIRAPFDFRPRADAARPDQPAPPPITPPASATPPQVPPPPSIDARPRPTPPTPPTPPAEAPPSPAAYTPPTTQEAAVLLGFGVDPQSLVEMNPEERADTIAEAQAAGVTPVPPDQAAATLADALARYRPQSERLTPEDRASPIPNAIIDEGKAGLEAAIRAADQPPLVLRDDQRVPAAALPPPAIVPPARTGQVPLSEADRLGVPTRPGQTGLLPTLRLGQDPRTRQVPPAGDTTLRLTERERTDLGAPLPLTARERIQELPDGRRVSFDAPLQLNNPVPATRSDASARRAPADATSTQAEAPLRLTGRDRVVETQDGRRVSFDAPLQLTNPVQAERRRASSSPAPERSAAQDAPPARERWSSMSREERTAVARDAGVRMERGAAVERRPWEGIPVRARQSLERSILQRPQSQQSQQSQSPAEAPAQPRQQAEAPAPAQTQDPRPSAPQRRAVAPWRDGSVVLRGVEGKEAREIGERIGVRPVYSREAEGYLFPEERRRELTEAVAPRGARELPARKQAERRQQARQSLRDTLTRRGFGDVALRFEDEVFGPEESTAADRARAGEGAPEGQRVVGQYRQRGGNAEIVIRNASDENATLTEETVHAARNMGLFKDEEWRQLERKAERRWMDQYDIEAKYPDKTREQQIEEAVAAAAVASESETGPERTLLQKLSDFFEAVREWYRGNGFQTADEAIFRKLREGEIGRRERNPAAMQRDVTMDAREDADTEGEGQPERPVLTKEQATRLRRAWRKTAGFDDMMKLASSRRFKNIDELKAAMQEKVRAALAKAQIDLSKDDQETWANLVAIAVDDGKRALDQFPEANGWYDETTRAALRVMSRVHPEIGTDINHRFAFVWITAVLSNGMKVMPNFKMADKVYERWVKSVKDAGGDFSKGKMPDDVGVGQAAQSINVGMRKFNEMVGVYGIDRFRELMLTEMTNAEIGLLFDAQATGENAAAKLIGAAILGPKIGNGFFANLFGRFDALTMDRWFVRTVLRWRGQLLQPNPVLIQAAADRLEVAVVQLNKPWNAADKAKAERVVGADLTLPDGGTPQERSARLLEIASAVAGASVDKDVRRQMNRLLAGNEKIGPELRKAGNRLDILALGAVEQPANGSNRAFVRSAMEEALRRLQSDPAYKTLTMSDFQAVLWYGERALYKRATGKDEAADANADADYLTAARAVAKERGVPDDVVEAAVQFGRGRGEDGRPADAARRGDGSGGVPAAAEFAAIERREGGLGRRDLGQELRLATSRRFGIGPVRSDRRGDGAAPRPYARESGGDGGSLRVLGQPALAKYTPATKFRNAARTAGASAPVFFEMDPAQSAATFRDALMASKAESKFGAAVYVYDEAGYRGMRLFLTKDGKAGFALKGDDIVSVFSRPGQKEKGGVVGAIELAVQLGGRKLDAFDTVLPNIYSAHRFKVVARVPWDESQKPEDWDKTVFAEFNNGEPDVVMMVWDPDHAGGAPTTDGARVPQGYDGYNEAVRIQSEEVAKVARKTGLKPAVERENRERREDTAPASPITEEMRAVLRERLTAIVGEQVALRFDAGLAGRGAIRPAGAYRQTGTDAEIVIGQSLNPERTLNHEAIHALYNLGMFTDKEWAALTRRARSFWMKRHNVEGRYPEGDQALWEEEAIAEAFADWAQGRRQAGADDVRGAFEKIRAFFEALRNWAAGNGFRTAEDIFRQIDRGEIGDRQTGNTAPEDGGVIPSLREDGPVSAQSRDRAPLYQSAVQRAVNNLRQDKANGLQWLAMIRKSPGVKQEELDWLGLPTWLGDRKGITREEVRDYIRANQVQVEEVVKGDREDPNNTGTSYSNYVTPGGEEYRELLIRLPGEDPTFAVYNGERKVSEDYATEDEARTARRGFYITDPDGGAGLTVRQSNDPQAYNTVHWKEPNVLAHIRFNERKVPVIPEASLSDIEQRVMAATGVAKASDLGSGAPIAAVRKGAITQQEAAYFAAQRGFYGMDAPQTQRILFVEEIQSDWHQSGRKRGYAGDAIDTSGWTVERRAIKGYPVEIVVYDNEGVDVGYFYEEMPDADAIARAAEAYDTSRVPDAPLKKTWHELAFRRAAAWAAENGFDGVAWTTGDMQNERYDLASQIDSLWYRKTEDGKYFLSADAGEGEMFRQGAVPEDRLAEYVGVDIAAAITRGEGRPIGDSDPRYEPDPEARVIEGNLLRSIPGGEGMKGFYDRILPTYAKKWGKRFGAVPSMMKMPTSGRVTEDVHFMPVTDEMRESIRDSGIELFQRPDITREDRQNAAEAPPPFRTFEHHTSHEIMRMMSPGNWGALAENAGDLRAALIRKYADSFNDVKRQQGAIEEARGAPLDLAQDTYTIQSLYAGRTGERLERLHEGPVRKITRAIRKAGLSQRQVDDYLTALHAEERNGHIASLYEIENPDHDFARATEDPDVVGGSGMSANEARQIIAEAHAGPKAAALKEIAQDVRAMLDEALQLQVSSGLISADAARAMRDAYRHYVPLRGFDGKEAEDGLGTGRGFDIRGLESKRAMGRRSKSDSPLAYAFAQAANTIIRSEKNRVGKTFLRMALANPNPAAWEVNRTETRKAIKRKLYMVEDPETGLFGVEERDQVTERQAAPMRFDDSVLIVKNGGEEVTITIKNPDIARAMKNLNPENMNGWVRALAAVTRTMAALNTSWNIEWFAVNILRDLQSAGIQISDEGKKGLGRKMLANWPAALKGAFQYNSGLGNSEWRKIAEDFAMHGGKVNYIDFKGVEEFKDMIASEADASTAGVMRRMVAAGPKAAFRGLEVLTSSGENAIRIAAYKAAVDMGVPKTKAASIARELTINFNRRGTSGPGINAFYMFFNAAVQGNRRLLQSVAKSRFTRRALAGLAIMGMAEVLLGAGDEDEYRKVEDWVRERNFVLMLHPMGLGEPGEYIKIPIPYGFNVAKTAGTEFMQMLALGKDPGEAATTIVAAMVNSFNPIGGQDFYAVVSPTVLDPIVDIGMNRNFFGSQVAPFSRQDDPKPASERYFPNVNPIMRDFTAWLNEATGGNTFRPGRISLSPEHIDHLISAYTGGVGRLFQRSSNTIASLAAGDPVDIEKTPLLRNFYAQTVGEMPTWRAYDAISNAAHALRYEIEGNRKAGNEDKVREAEARDPVLTDLYRYFQGRDKLLNSLRRQMKEVSASRMSEDAMQERLDGIRARMFEVQREALKRYDETRAALR